MAVWYLPQQRATVGEFTQSKQSNDGYSNGMTTDVYLFLRGISLGKSTANSQIVFDAALLLLLLPPGFYNVCGHVHLACSFARACRVAAPAHVARRA